MQRLETTATVLAWIAFGGCMVGLAFLFAMYGMRLDRSIFAFGAAVFLLVLAACSLWILRRPAVDRVGPTVSLLVVLSCLALMDLYFGQVERFNPRVARAAELGVPFDERTILNAVLDLRDDGRQVYPTVTPREFHSRPLETQDGPVLPYALPAGAEVVLCNEQGRYVHVRTDEKGFVNPVGAWDEQRAVDVLLVGDSFAEGWCVEQGDAAASLIRKSGWRLVNVGRGGLGPIGALGAVREFSAAVKPKAVVWFFFEGNDFADFKDERQSPLMRKYLDRDWRQGLLARAAAVDAALRDYVERNLASYRLRSEFPFLKWRQKLPREDVGGFFRRTFGVAETRETPPRAGAVPSSAPGPGAARAPVTVASVVRQTVGEIRQGDALALFVYLPDIHAFPERRRSAAAKENVLRAARESGATVVDLEATFRRFAPDPRDLFPMKMDGHYNERGHALLARAVAAALAEKLSPARR